MPRAGKPNPSRRVRRGWAPWGITVAAVALVLAAGPAGANERDRVQVQEDVNAALAEIDGLLATDPASAVARSEVLFARFGDDPLYGWQVEGRLATALLVADRPAEALPHLEQMVRTDPVNPAWHRNLAEALRRMGRRGRALTEYGLVVELSPDDPSAHLEYGQYLLEFRNYPLARHHLEKAWELCGGCAVADRALANLHLARGDFGSAVPPLRRLASAGEDPQVERSLLAALARSGGDEELLARLESVGIPALDAEELGLLVEAEGRLGRAGHSLVFATSNDDGLPANGTFWGRVALNLLEAEEYEAGLAAADRAVELEPGSIVNRTNRAVLLQRLGREEEARREMEEVRRLEPDRNTEQTE